jgi:biopolymer transport protein TolR
MLRHHANWGRFTVRARGAPKADINVTPLVDVVLVLLIIFMVVTPLVDEMLRVRVPDAERIVEHDGPAQIVVSVAGDGALLVDAEAVPDDRYVERLRRVLAARAPGERNVFVTADDEALHARLVLALDGARRAGAEIMTMTAERTPAARAGGGDAGPP